MNEKTIYEIIEEVKADICDNYCKFSNQCIEELDQDKIDKLCDKCPLNRL